MQSFAYQVKSELCRVPVQRSCCARAEAYGVLLYCNTFNAREIRIITENPEFAKRLPKLFHKAFNLRFDRLPEEQEGRERSRIPASWSALSASSATRPGRHWRCTSTSACWRTTAAALLSCGARSSPAAA